MQIPCTSIRYFYSRERPRVPACPPPVFPQNGRTEELSKITCSSNPIYTALLLSVFELRAAVAVQKSPRLARRLISSEQNARIGTAPNVESKYPCFARARQLSKYVRFCGFAAISRKNSGWLPVVHDKTYICDSQKSNGKRVSTALSVLRLESVARYSWEMGSVHRHWVARRVALCS